MALAAEVSATKSNLDQLCINSIRVLAIDAVQKANSGHPGMPMGMAPAGYLLFTRFMRHNPRNPKWYGRDRFVLSAGHGSMLLYALLYLTGYDVTLDDIMQFRQLGSRTPGHPECHLTPGVETTTGPLGQGFGNGIGMAIAAKHMAARHGREAGDLFDHRIFAI
ncbi:MAG: transketolase, partial [Candidatus Binataceae bacterium]